MRQLDHHETPLQDRKLPLVIACDGWSDPRNVGMLFRLADGFGVQSIILGGSTPAPPHKKIHRSARSAEQWVPFELAPDLALRLMDLQREEGYTLVGLELTDASIDIYQYPFRSKDKKILVCGAEREGISPEVLACLDACVCIPLYGRISSLNVSTALAVALGEIGRQAGQPKR